MDVDDARYDKLLGPDTEHYRCPTSSSAVWIILLAIAFLAIIGLVIWVVYLYHRKNRNENDKTTVLLLEPSFIVTDNTVSAYWTNTKETDGNKYYLYVTRNPPFYGATGAVLNQTAQQNTQVSSDGASTISVPGLTRGIKYYATLVATNSKTSNYKVYTQIVYLEENNPPGPLNNVNSNFAIEHILQGGAIQIGSTGTTTSGETTYNIEYNTDPSCQRQVFFINAAGQIQSSDTSTYPNLCLHNVNGILGARECNMAGGNADSSWVYNKEGLTNKWCLLNSINVNGVTGITGAACMSLGALNTTSHSAQISVITKSQPGDAWANYYRTFPPT